MTSCKLRFVVFIVMMVATMEIHNTVAQTTHVVGGPLGWTIPPVGPFAYSLWTTLMTFNVGDNLVFNFPTGVHTVAEVSPAAYNSCDIANPISLMTTGPATVTLTTPGQHYYICTVVTHCQLGQRLAINVAAAAAAPTSSPPTTAAPSLGPISSITTTT